MCKCFACKKRLSTNQEIGDARLKNPKRLLVAKLFLSALGKPDEAKGLNRDSYLCKECSYIEVEKGHKRAVINIFGEEGTNELMYLIQYAYVERARKKESLGF